MSVVAQIWVTFVLNILKDVILQYILNSSKFKKGYLWTKRHWLLIWITKGKFIKKYKSFIREKNEIFSLVFESFKEKDSKNPAFFFSSLTQYWTLKRSLIQQYEKLLRINLVDDEYDIFEDEIKKAKISNSKNSLKRLIWKLKVIDPEFKNLFEQSEKNLAFLKELSSKKSITESQSLSEFKITQKTKEELKELISSYTKDLKKMISNLISSDNKIRNLEKFELYTEVKLIQKYTRELGLKINFQDPENILKVTKYLDNFLFLNTEKLSDKKIKKQYISAEKSYLKQYYKLLKNKHIIVNFSKKISYDLAPSDAALIINKSNEWNLQKQEWLSITVDHKEDSESKWKIAYKLWELNEIRKNICFTYLGIDSDFSKWVSNFEKLQKLALEADPSLTQEQFDKSKKFLKNEINPSQVFGI